MLKRLILPTLLGTTLLAGCDLAPGQVGQDRINQVQNQVNQQQQQQQQPTPTPGGTTTLKVGQKWVYAISVDAPVVGKMTGEVTNEVTKVDGDVVTFNSTTQLAGQSVVSVPKTVKLTDADPYAGLVMEQSMKITSGPTFSDESVTVAAGTFAARKAAYVGTKDGAEMTVNSWATKDLGVIKYDIVTKIAAPALPAIPAGLPGVPAGLSGGQSSSLTTITSVELKSFTK